MQKNLSVLLKRLGKTFNNFTVTQNIEKIITSLDFDSRAVKEGSLFFALPGTHIHGNKFIPQVLDKKASAVVYQDEISADIIEKAKEKNIPLIHVPDTRFAMSPLADEFYESPSKKMIVIGITGTEGKSSTTSFVYQLLKLLGKKAGFISTVQYSIGDEPVNNPEHQTTPEAPIVQRQLYEMLQNGCEYAVVESSSHGLSKRTNRLGDVLFDVAVMMNVTQEHLEFHGTLEQYKSDKANLFRALDMHDHKKTISGKSLTVRSFGVVNTDDKAAEYFCKSTKKSIYGFSMNENDSLTGLTLPENLITIARNTKRTNDANGSDFFAGGCMLRINLPGEFNIYNTLAASLVVSNLLEKEALKNPLDFPKYIPETLPKLKPVCGRMTKIDEGQNFEVIVDYAHTPSSFRTIFPPIKARAKGRIISLFGSGGERDLQKRPEQGKIADEFSDIIILTDEDPRGEDSFELLEGIAKGIKNKEREKNLFIIPDRPRAIRHAFSLAKKDDIVLLLGKSHENSIIFKDHVMPYDEIAEAKKALQEMKK